MNKGNTLLIVIVVLVALIFVGFNSLYTVNEAEQVVILQLGKVVNKVTEPGLNTKIPFIQKVRVFDKRWLEWDGDASQVPTVDQGFIYIDVFARWRIVDPAKFIAILRDEASAQSRLDDIIDSATRNVVARNKLIEAVRSTNRPFSPEAIQVVQSTPPVVDPALAPVLVPEVDTEAEAEAEAEVDTDTDTEDSQEEKKVAVPTPVPAPVLATPAPKTNAERKDALYMAKIGRQKLTRLILDAASSKASALGIEIKDVQIKRINYASSVQAKVFDRMISERTRIAEKHRSEGQGRREEILGTMEKELARIRSQANKQALKIRGAADGTVTKIYADAYNRDPEFYTFLKTLESYRITVSDKTWMLLTTDVDWAKYLSKKKGPKH